jgi:hypothetical protein
VAIQIIHPRIIKPQKERILKICCPIGSFLKQFAAKLVETGDFPILRP